LLFDVPEGEVRARAVVRRPSPNKGMAVRFVSMQPESYAPRPLAQQSLPQLSWRLRINQN